MKQFPEDFHRRGFRREINRIALLLISYEAIVFVVSIAGAIFLSVQQMLSETAQTDIAAAIDTNSLAANGWPYIIGVLIAVTIAIIFRKKTVLRQDLTRRESGMRPYDFVVFMALFMTVQLSNQLLVTALESSLNFFGYSMTESMKSLESIGSSVSMFLYVVLIGPVAEEVVFRGVVLRSLEKYGKLFAIVFSSVMFGLIHGNLYQGFFAFGLGLVLAYVALEYSFKWAVILHVTNNLIFGELVFYLVKHFGQSTVAAFQFVLFTLFFIFALIVLLKNRASIQNYLQSNRTVKGLYFLAFTSAFVLLYFAINLLITRMSITRLMG